MEEFHTPNTSPDDNNGKERDISFFTISTITGLVIFILIIAFFSLGEYILSTPVEPEQYIFLPEEARLRELREREDEILNSYKLLDPEKGIYRIPIARAMEITAREAAETR